MISPFVRCVGGGGGDALVRLCIPEAIRCVLLCMPEAEEGDLCLLEVLGVLEAMRCVLLCMPEAVEGRLCSMEVLEVMCCALLYNCGG